MKAIVMLAAVILVSVCFSFAQSQPAQKQKPVKVTTEQVLNPLYIVKIDDDMYELLPSDDGTDNLKFLDSSQIESVDVYKGDDAVDKFGDKGKNGVLVIQLKYHREEDLPDSLKGIVKKIDI
jgi:hypothetical protein